MNRAQRRREEQSARKRANSSDVGSALEQGLEHHRSGRPAAARQCYEQALRLGAGNVRALFLLGTLAAQEGDVGTAEHLIRQAIEGDPNNAAYHNNLGVILREAGRLDESLDSYRAAVALRPDYAEAHCNLGVALKEAGRAEEAVASLERAVELDPDYTGAYSNLGNALHELGRSEAAMAAFDKAVALAPGDPSPHFNRALALQVLGETDTARKGFREVLRMHPRHGEAWRLLANLTRYSSSEDSDVRSMSRLIESGSVDGHDVMHLHFGLGKALEDAGDVDAAFEQFTKANAGYRKSYDYDIAKDAEYFESIKRNFSDGFLADREDWGCNSDRPIFIVGMMRSGTSLVEQILASHPQVAGGGELKELDRLTRRDEARPDGAEYPDSALALDAAKAKLLGETYVHALDRHVGDANHVTDKMPGNFQYVGLLRLLLPKAMVIHCVRDPVDTCLSCYRNYFSGFHPFAYDLTELGQYYRLYRDLMDHWREVVPGYVHEIGYEDLVSDPEAQIRHLLETSGLDWDDRCLAFHETRRAVRTASAAQVRQPMYRSSVRAWKKFEKHLGPLLESLK